MCKWSIEGDHRADVMYNVDLLYTILRVREQGVWPNLSSIFVLALCSMSHFPIVIYISKLILKYSVLEVLEDGTIVYTNSSQLGIFIPQMKFSNICRYVWLLQQGRRCWHLVGSRKGCCWTGQSPIDISKCQWCQGWETLIYCLEMNAKKRTQIFLFIFLDVKEMCWD
jgi:hypothetical protein